MRNRLPRLLGDWRDNTLHVGVNDVENNGHWVTIFGKNIQYIECLFEITNNNIASCAIFFETWSLRLKE